ncbi:MAG: hypothetical protein EAZ57_02735 [Cytophagales bacterium]|nr:MAG: hypothetical protein EAZ67_03200 [Cytophagales bacterium]TAF61678.1 MAG: hypothetical protein EAZ57_02735 [Cytophagales bacterium]
MFLKFLLVSICLFFLLKWVLKAAIKFFAPKLLQKLVKTVIEKQTSKQAEPFGSYNRGGSQRAPDDFDDYEDLTPKP